MDGSGARVGGTKVIDAHDDAFKEAGRFGVWTKADSIVQFDDLTARSCARHAPSDQRNRAAGVLAFLRGLMQALETNLSLAGDFEQRTSRVR